MNDIFIDFIIDKMIAPVLEEQEGGDLDDGECLLQKVNDSGPDE